MDNQDLQVVLDWLDHRELLAHQEKEVYRVSPDHRVPLEILVHRDQMDRPVLGDRMVSRDLQASRE